MKKIWQMLGIIVFWVTWPLLWLVLRGSHRTRLLLVCNDEFLVVRGWLNSGKWGLPGGGLHQNENPFDGLLREVKEEIGVSLTQQQTKHAFDAFCSDRGLKFHYFAFVAEISEKPKIHRQSLEIAATIWQPLKKPKVLLTPDTQALLDWWLKRR